MPLIGMAGSTVMMLPLAKALALAIENEFDAFEVFGAFPQCVCDEVGPLERDALRRDIEASGIALAVHAPFTSLNIAALNPGVRRESVKQTNDAIDLCADLGGKVVIVHTGEEVFKHEKARELAWSYNIESLQQIAAHACNRCVTLCLENIGFEPEHMDRNIDDLLRIRREVGPEIMSFCLDIGHARLNNELGYAIEKMGPDVRHIHFTDNFGKKDDHVVIGEGDFDYSPHLDFFRNFDGIITLEVVVVGMDPEPAIKSRENFKRLVLGE